MRISINFDDQRFDDMNVAPEKVPALLHEMIEHHLWALTDPQVRGLSIAVEPPELCLGMGLSEVELELPDVNVDLSELEKGLLSPEEIQELEKGLVSAEDLQKTIRELEESRLKP